jgi:hypothetical protein
MSKYFRFVALIPFLFVAAFSHAQCKSLKEQKDEFIRIVKPYDFEGISGGTLAAGKTRSISVSVFSKVKYRLHFRADGFDSPVIIKVLTVNRQQLWSNEKDPGNLSYEFIPQKSDKYFVEFSAPGSNYDDARGCVAVVLSSRPY